MRLNIIGTIYVGVIIVVFSLNETFAMPTVFLDNTGETEKLSTRVASTPVSHQLWDELLKSYVSPEGKVNYKGLKQQAAQLQTYLDMLGKQAPDDSWSRNEKLAYWINVYNAFTVKLIIDNYPLKSITDLEKPWHKQFIRIGTQTYSLNQVEHEIIRKQFKEPRIHFAVNCASLSCPELLNEAFTAEKLDRQLTTLTREYINNPRHNSISANKVVLSKIFEWYGEDFKQGGGLIDFINKFAATKVASNASIAFRAYDWGLNE